MRNNWPAGVSNGACRSRVRSHLLSNAALAALRPCEQNTQSHLERASYGRAAHLLGRPTCGLERELVEVVLLLALAPPLAAVNVAPVAPPEPPQHPARRARAEALARLALSSRQEARVPHPMARRRPRWRARACAPTLGSERAREPPSGDVEQPADRAEKVVVGGRWVDDGDACVAAPPRQLWRPRWAPPRRSEPPLPSGLARVTEIPRKMAAPRRSIA